MNYQELLKRSWNIVWKNKFLWLLGLLVGGAGQSFPQWILDSGDSNWNEYFPSDSSSLVRAEVKDLGTVLGESFQSYPDKSTLIIASVILLLFFLLIIYLATTARGAIVRSVLLIQEKKEIGLKRAWSLGHKSFWRLLSLELLTLLIFFAFFFVLAVPVALLGIFGLTLPAFAVGAIFVIVFILFCIYFSLILAYAERILIIERRQAAESLKRAVIFFNRHWRQLILLYLVLLAIGIVFGIGMILAFVIIAIIIFCLGLVISIFLGPLVTIIYGVIFGLAGVVLFLAAIGIFGAFFSANYTLAFDDLRQSEK